MEKTNNPTQQFDKNYWYNQAMLEKPLNIIIEGAVGTGKSTQAGTIVDWCQHYNYTYQLYDENFLEDPEFEEFYKNKEKNFRKFQLHVAKRRSEQVWEAVRNPAQVNIFVRSIKAGEIFYQMTGLPTDKELNQAWNGLNQFFVDAFVIHLEPSKETAIFNIKRRGRKMEQNDEKYFQELHEKYLPAIIKMFKKKLYVIRSGSEVGIQAVAETVWVILNVIRKAWGEAFAQGKYAPWRPSVTYLHNDPTKKTTVEYGEYRFQNLFNKYENVEWIFANETADFEKIVRKGYYDTVMMQINDQQEVWLFDGENWKDSKNFDKRGIYGKIIHGKIIGYMVVPEGLNYKNEKLIQFVWDGNTE